MDTKAKKTPRRSGFSGTQVWEVGGLLGQVKGQGKQQTGLTLLSKVPQVNAVPGHPKPSSVRAGAAVALIHLPEEQR